MNEPLRSELLEMERRDQEVRARLAESGELFRGYHAEMRELQERYGRRLEKIVDQHGWPGRSLVGEDGAQAAWLICQHAISMPVLMRRCRDLLEAAVSAGEAPARHLAYLEDRIRTFEGRPQRYGTQFDVANEPHPIEDPEHLDERRRAVGLGPFAEYAERMRGQGPEPVSDVEAKRRASEEFARVVGWRD